MSVVTSDATLLHPPKTLDGRDADLEFLRSTSLPEPAAGRTIAVSDLFSGCGGLTIGAVEGARRSGVSASVAVAIDQQRIALDVMHSTLGSDPRAYVVADLGSTLRPFGDRTTAAERNLFSGVQTSLLLAGPPCQGHSALNNRTRHDDPRNALYVSVARAARLLEPDVVVIENVRGVRADRGGAVEECSRLLERLGYAVTARLVNLLELGAPQRRIRHVLVATAKGTFTWILPVLSTRTVGWAIGDLLDAEPTSPFDTPSSQSAKNATRIKWLFANNRDDLPNHRRPQCHRGKHSYHSMYGRLSWEGPAQTITSGFGSMGQGRYVHPLRRRTLTPHEAARLQFMPDFVRFDQVNARTTLATMIGNVAPPVLTIAITRALIEQKLL